MFAICRDVRAVARRSRGSFQSVATDEGIDAAEGAATGREVNASKRRSSYMSGGVAARGVSWACNFGARASKGESRDLVSGAGAFAGSYCGGFRMLQQRRSLVIRAALAPASVVPGRRIGRGRNSIGPAVTHPAIHALPAFLSPAMLTLIAQVHSPQNLWTTNNDSTRIRSTCARPANAPSCIVELKIFVFLANNFRDPEGYPSVGARHKGIHAGPKR
jgi:hypothetical protein